MWHIELMASVNMRQLRDTKRLKNLLRAGATVELRERDRVIARIVPEPQETGTVNIPTSPPAAKKCSAIAFFPEPTWSSKSVDDIDRIRGHQLLCLDLHSRQPLGGGK